ncbi:MAG: polysaccharide pyruvyl transferase family protein [Acidimicrobiia bacterium]
MPTALLAGAFGQANPGDEALLEAFVAALPGWDAVATSQRPVETRSRHGCDAVSSHEPAAVARAARRADVVVFAGGTVFKHLHPSTDRRPLGLLAGAGALAVGARAAGTRVALVGVGADHLRTPMARRLARGVVRRSQLTVLRDEDSAAALAAAGAPVPFRVGADPAWTLVGGGRDATGRRRRDVVVVALSHLAIRRPDTAGEVARALRPLAASGFEVHLQPWQDDAAGRDHLLAGALAARLGGGTRIVGPPATLSAARRQFGEARAVVGFRFHAVVAAAAAGTPFVAVAHEPKLAALGRRFEQPVLDPSAGMGALPQCLAAALGGRRPSAAVARSQVAAAEEGFRLLRLVATGGHLEDLDTLTGLPLVPEVAAR